MCVVFALLPVEEAPYINCKTNFKCFGLDSFELAVDSVNLPGFPLRTHGSTSMDFYHKFLKVTNFFDNPYSNGPLTYEEFGNGNFLIVENLQRLNIFSGDLTARLKFKQQLTQKLYLVMMPIYQKKITFDDFFNVTVSDMNVNEANKQNDKIPY